MLCDDCGTKLTLADDFCPGCGLALDEMANRLPRRRPRLRELPPLRSSLAIVGAILVPIGVVLFFVAIILNDEFRRARAPPFMTFSSPPPSSPLSRLS